MSRNPYTALGKLREELWAYIELNINNPPKKNIYIFIIALSKIVKNSIKEAVLIVLFLPFSLNS